jgi:hypothetical protein
MAAQVTARLRGLLMSLLGSVRVSSFTLLVGFTVALTACDNPNPGTPLGSFAVTSALSANTCGGAVADTNPGSFSVTLSNDQGIVYWFPDTGASSASGSLSSTRTVNIREGVADDVDQKDGSAAACTLQREDTLSFTLAAGSAPASFTGSYSFTVEAAAGASCADQLASAGGGYTTLPCTITYTLSGTRQ